MAVKDYVRLMRPHQWYKNVLVFIPIIFGQVSVFADWGTQGVPAVFTLSNYPPLILGFAVLCAVSSAGYIFNDIADIEHDAAHPEKRERPLPSGRASRTNARSLAALLMISGLLVGYLQNIGFFLMIIFYIINSQLYNAVLRNLAVVDVATIAVGFIIRAIAGTFLIGVPFTSWLVIGVFFVALVLGFGKRKNELQLLGEDAAKHKPVFNEYTDKMLDHGITMSATWVVLFYALYCYENFRNVLDTQPVMMTVPIVAGVVLRYVYLVQSGSPVGRKPHLAFRDRGFLAGGILFGIVLVLTLFFYVPIYDWFFSLLPQLFPPIIPP
ncbi:MAG: decaprenyl-phosphate phosphoribosyltransferase [Candidatus Thorarchaeota archaeon]